MVNEAALKYAGISSSTFPNKVSGGEIILKNGKIKTNRLNVRSSKVYGNGALGTDFPVEQVNPFLTFYAATIRKNLNNYPKNGFQMKNYLSREKTLKGMTIWAAYSNFEEDEKESIEVGKFANFVTLSQDIMRVNGSKIPKKMQFQHI